MLTVFVSVIICVCGKYVWDNGYLRDNVHALVDKNYMSDKYYSWNQFYAEDMFGSIKEYIGIEDDKYRVVSLGIFPSVALENGMYCLDGYSNNYSLEYKHEFRKIIAKELDKNEFIKKYFDNGGNRCYIYSSETLNNFFIKQGSGIVLEELELDTVQMKKMGCQYILSAVKINGIIDNLKFERLFQQEGVPYEIYLYSVE